MFKLKNITTFLFLLVSLFSFSQKTKVYGTVIDKITKETMPFVNISFKGTKIGFTSDIDGNFKIETYYASDSLVFSYIGYLPYTVKINRDKSQKILVELSQSDLMLESVEIVGDRNKENPAHILIRNVIRNKRINNRVKLDAYQYEVYNKIEFDINNFGDKFRKRKMFKSVDFVFDMIDTSTGKPYLPVFIVESLSDYYYTRKPKRKKEFIKAAKISGVENKSISQFLGDMYQNINIYDNTLDIFDRRFISPLNNSALFHYNMYITDSAFIGKSWCYKLEFMPKRSSELTLKGEMWINDTTYAVKQIEADISENANINFVNSYHLKQTFEQVENEVWMMILDETIADINPLESEKQVGFYGRKTTSYQNFVINKPKEDGFYSKGLNVVVLDSSENKSQEFWDENRHISLSKKEKEIYKMIDTLKEIPMLKMQYEIMKVLVSGYKTIGPIEIGPYYSLHTSNPIEGFRVQFGIRTSNDFSTKLMLEANAAYGFLDERLKYNFRTFAFVTKKPRRYFDIKYKNDVSQFDKNDFFGSSSQNLIAMLFRRNPYNKLVNTEGFNVLYFNEWKEGFSNTLTFRNYEIRTLGDILKFSRTSGSVTATRNSLFASEVSLGMHYAKNEKFISGEFLRQSLSTSSPVFDLDITFGLKNILNSSYEYQKIKLSVKDRIYLGYLGNFFYKFEIGKLFGNVPYPFLFMHEGNETRGSYKYGFNAMNIGEFMSDEYVSLIVQHHFEGLFLNRIPLLKRLKWREVIVGKAIYGRLNDRHLEVMDLPYFTSSLKEKPYIEASAGIENIFRVFRIDLLWRINYIDNTYENIDVLRFGVRGRFQISF